MYEKKFRETTKRFWEKIETTATTTRSLLGGTKFQISITKCIGRIRLSGLYLPVLTSVTLFSCSIMFHGNLIPTYTEIAESYSILAGGKKR